MKEEITADQIFCPICIEDTLPQTTGNLLRINFVGTTIKNIGFRCNICKSLVAEKRFTLYGIPIHTFGYFRIQEIYPRSFYARKLKDQKYYGLNSTKGFAK